MTNKYGLMVYWFLNSIAQAVLTILMIIDVSEIKPMIMWVVYCIVNAGFSFVTATYIFLLIYLHDYNNDQDFKIRQVMPIVISIPIFAMSISAITYIENIQNMFGISSIISTVLTGISYIFVIGFVSIVNTNEPDDA